MQGEKKDQDMIINRICKKLKKNMSLLQKNKVCFFFLFLHYSIFSNPSRLHTFKDTIFSSQDATFSSQDVTFFSQDLTFSPQDFTFSLKCHFFFLFLFLSQDVAFSSQDTTFPFLSISSSPIL